MVHLTQAPNKNDFHKQHEMIYTKNSKFMSPFIPLTFVSLENTLSINRTEMTITREKASVTML